jgi:endonuclease-3
MGGPASVRLPVILQRLDSAYGRPAHALEGDPLDSLIATILSQNTTDANSHRTFAQLKAKFPTWEQALAARPSQIAAAIRLGGLADVRSKRIKQVLQRILEDYGVLDLAWLRLRSVAQGTGYLTALPGVGPKTAACVLLFSLKKPAFPVDTHVLRVSKRLGLLPPNTTLERAHELYARLLGPQENGGLGWNARDMLGLHLGLVRHGREICQTRRPRCEACLLVALCPKVGVRDLLTKEGKR